LFDVPAERPGAVPTVAGYDMAVSHGLPVLETANAVVIPGWQRREHPAA
jgi:AraC family transcriptional regulator, transcriptional activator FtrA